MVLVNAMAMTRVKAKITKGVYLKERPRISCREQEKVARKQDCKDIIFFCPEGLESNLLLNHQAIGLSYFE